MKRDYHILILAMAMVFGFTPSAQATSFTLSLVYSGDANSITQIAGKEIKEDYQETILVPFNSSIPSIPFQEVGLVSPLGHYFDNTITISPTGNNHDIELTFKPTNTTNFTWQDYHFLLVNPPIGVSFTNASAHSPFENISFNGTEIAYWSTDSSKFVKIGDEANMTIKIAFPARHDVTITLRQIASSDPIPGSLVPIPGALPLLGSGLLRLAIYRRQKLASNI